MVQRTSRGFKMWLTQSLPEQDPNKSLMEKWREMKERKKKHGDATALSQVCINENLRVKK